MTPEQIRKKITYRNFYNETTYSEKLDIDKLCEFLSTLTKQYGKICKTQWCVKNN